MNILEADRRTFDQDWVLIVSLKVHLSAHPGS
jgi:hypothetical protein